MTPLVPPRSRGQAWFELTGVVPLGLFVVVHLASYASVLAGADTFGVASGGVLFLVLEVALVWLPLAIHAGYGLRRLWARLEPDPAERARSVVLRASGGLALAVIAAHVAYFRVPLLRGRIAPEDLAELLAARFSSTVDGVPWFAIVHLLGVAAVTAHLGLGLERFLCRSGIARVRSARRFSFLVAGLSFCVGSATVVALATGSALPRFLY